MVSRPNATRDLCKTKVKYYPLDLDMSKSLVTLELFGENLGVEDSSGLKSDSDPVFIGLLSFESVFL